MPPAGASGPTAMRRGRLRTRLSWPDRPGEQDVGLIYRQMGRKGLESIEDVGPRLAEVIEGLLSRLSPGSVKRLLAMTDFAAALESRRSPIASSHDLQYNGV